MSRHDAPAAVPGLLDAVPTFQTGCHHAQRGACDLLDALLIGAFLAAIIVTGIGLPA